MKKLLGIVLFFFLTLEVNAAPPRVWFFSGTATTTSAPKTVGNTVPFNPASVCIFNDSATIILHVNMSIGVASTTNDADNISILPNEVHCYSFRSGNALDTFIVATRSASSTVAFRVEAIR